MFKHRPYWPSKEFQAEVKKDFGVVINSWFTYDVKRRAHKLLHGSMKEHYNKVGRYIEALKYQIMVALSYLQQTSQLPRTFQLFRGFRYALRFKAGLTIRA